MSRQTLLRSQLEEELKIVFKKRISNLKDELGRRERTPYSSSEVQKVELEKHKYKLSVAILAQDQILDLIKYHVHV